MPGWYWVSYIVLWSVVLIQGVGLFALYYHFGQMYLSSPQGRSHQGPDLGRLLKQIVGKDLDGVDAVGGGTPSILVFTDTECRICSELKPTIAAFATSHASVDVAVVCAADGVELAESWSSALGDRVRVVPDLQRRISSKLRIGITPFMLAIDAAGRVCDKGVLSGIDDLDRALHMATQHAPVIVKGA